jgi:polyferredoxin
MKQIFFSKRNVFLVLTTCFILLIISSFFFQSSNPGTLNKFFSFWSLHRVWIGVIFCSIGGIILWKARLTQNLRLGFLSIIFFVFAILPALPLGDITRGLGIHPSPMCIVSKPFLFINAGKTIPIIFFSLLLSIIILTIVGNKLFCGWVCPIGAIQEIFNRIPLPTKYKIKLPFKVTNLIRISLFILYIGLIFLLGIGIYDYINPFEFLHWNFELWGIVFIFIVLITSVFIFRPFCYLICPLGLVTWFFEQISLVKIKIDEYGCTDCEICVEESPCPAMNAILEKDKIIPDCHACGYCIKSCPENAIEFKL